MAMEVVKWSAGYGYCNCDTQAEPFSPKSKIRTTSGKFGKAAKNDDGHSRGSEAGVSWVPILCLVFSALDLSYANIGGACV